ncbi:MAG: PD40 domain-containing protein [Candidatus Eisenbacteria bacterium]|nr:PD40 domain-containing protein [Candidatus Eisenbacteria bacterium]
MFVRSSGIIAADSARMSVTRLGTFLWGLLLWGSAVQPFTVATASAVEPQFLRRPDIHGDQIVFTSEGDLWLGSIASRTAARITSADGVEGSAHFSPDGASIAFSAQYDGGLDVYVMAVSGGAPRRLTWDPYGVVVQGWTADGSEILYRSQRQDPGRRSALWAVPAAGGGARMLPIPYVEFAAMHADGARVAYVPISAEWQHWKRYRGGLADDIWLADIATGAFRRLTDDPGIDTEPVWVGDAIYFVSERDGLANLYRLDPATGAATAVTRYSDHEVRYPGSDGNRVVYELGDGIGLFDPSTGQQEDLELNLRSDRLHTRVERVSAMQTLFATAIGPSGKRLLFSARGQILSAPIEHGDVRVVAAQPASRCQYPAWSHDGKSIAFVSDQSGEEQIWIAPATGGEARMLTRDHIGPLGPLVWSPDGTRIATTDRELRILLVDAKSGRFTEVDQSPQGSSYNLVNESYRFSPDGKWLAYAHLEPNWNWIIRLYEIATGKQTTVTSAAMSSYAPSFDPEGKYLYFLSDRVFSARYSSGNHYFAYDRPTKPIAIALAAGTKSPFLEENDQEGADDQAEKSGDAKGDEKKDAKGSGKKKGSTAPDLPEVKVDLAGISDRVIDVPVPADDYLRIEPVEGRLLLLTAEPGEGDTPPSRRLHAFSLEKKKQSVVVEKLSDFQITADAKKLLIQDDQSFTVMDVGADALPTDEGKVDTSGWMVTVDPTLEWKQIFHEAWRIGRDFFYDPGMHGVDWPAVRAKYERFLPGVADRSDLNFVLGEMIGELNCGHAYVFGGDLPDAPHQPMGYLGADLTAVGGDTPAYRVTKLFPGDGFDLAARSPLLTPGIDIKVGDHILAVSGHRVRVNQDLQQLLIGTAGQAITLTVNDRPSFDGAREVTVTPLSSEYQARYYDWVASRVRYIREQGGETLGYVHIPNMGMGGLGEFGKHYYPNLNRDGMIYDVRFNGGGFIDAMMLLQMSAKQYSYFKPRYGASWSRQDWAFRGHSVALVNDASGSNAEEFCDGFQRLGLGPVIGSRSWGGEVGSGGGYPLVDGGALFIPNYGAWVPEGKWIIEGKGVQPDIVVEEDPAALLAGRDPQLDRAIAYLKQRMAEAPVTRPLPPPYPNKAHGGSDKE